MAIKVLKPEAVANPERKRRDVPNFIPPPTPPGHRTERSRLTPTGRETALANMPTVTGFPVIMTDGSKVAFAVMENQKKAIYFPSHRDRFRNQMIGRDIIVRAMDNAAIREKLAPYHFYHCIRLSDEITTDGFPEFEIIQAPVRRKVESLDLSGKRVLDVGCRDGLFSFQAEQRGASEIMGIDNDLSRGAVEFLIPFFQSRVRMLALNLYDLLPEMYGTFDLMIFAGVLYHLRYPFWGLKRLRDVMAPGALLIIETAVYRAHEDRPLLYCPIGEESPYEPTSASYFNPKAATYATAEGALRRRASAFANGTTSANAAKACCQQGGSWPRSACAFCCPEQTRRPVLF